MSHPDDEDIDLDNPFAQDMLVNSGEGKGNKADKLGDKDEGDIHASQHTFYVNNSQRRLKLVAKNAVSLSAPRQ
jgi:phospholipase D1/2